MQPRERRNITLRAPVGTVDLAAFDDDGEPYEIHACSHCLPWHARFTSTAMAASSSESGTPWSAKSLRNLSSARRVSEGPPTHGQQRPARSCADQDTARDDVG